MIELNDFNVSQLEFKNLPSDEIIRLIMCGNIYKFESEFYINGIFINHDKSKYYLSLLPMKGLSAFPLGSIFGERKLTGENFITQIQDVKITVKMKLTGFNKIGEIEILKNKFSSIPDEISGYTKQRQAVLNQLVATYKDQISGKILYIPHYEIARWYYLKSSSLCRQTLSANLEGLYYEANYLNDEKTEAELFMKHGSSNADAADIFRFAKDEFANIMFNNFSLNLSANMYKNIKGKKYDITKIHANFPVHGELNLKIKGFSLDQSSIFVYQFIEEDSIYPFNELDVYRYGNNNKKDKVAIVDKKSPNKSDIGERIDDHTPSSEYENQTTENDVILNELRKGLEKKKINYKPLLKPSEDNDSVGEHTILVSGLDLELSLSDASKDGDENLVHSSLVNKAIDEDDQFQERENNLIIFRNMIFKLRDIDKKSKEPKNLSVTILNHANLPRKPKYYTGKARWKMARLSNGKPRQYMLVQIEFSHNTFYIIEIEKETHENIATAIFYMDNQISKDRLFQIVKDYVQYNGEWNFGKKTNHFFMYHTGNEDDMAKRLYKRFK